MPVNLLASSSCSRGTASTTTTVSTTLTRTCLPSTSCEPPHTSSPTNSSLASCQQHITRAMSALKRRLRRDFSPEDSEQELFESAPKRHRPNRTAPILHLSDELFLRIASHLQTRDLAAFQLVSHRCSRIAVDSQIWKKLYYHRFVRPRASRIPGLGRAQLGDYASRRSIWLEDEGIAREVGTNWKAQYRLRHNWGNGTCGIRKIDISGKEGDASDLLVKLFEVCYAPLGSTILQPHPSDGVSKVDVVVGAYRMVWR